ITLGRGQLYPLSDLGLRWQFGGNLLLGAAQQERLHPCAQQGKSFEIAVFFDGSSVMAGELLLPSQPARHQEVEERPKFTQMIFQWRPGQTEALPGVEHSQ